MRAIAVSTILSAMALSGLMAKPATKPICPEAYEYCRTHMAAATFDGVEPGLDGKTYYKYSHYQDGYPGGKHVILRSCK